MESFVTFEFQTRSTSSKAKPVLSDAEACKLATYVIKPVFLPENKPAGQSVRVLLSVDEQGHIDGVRNPDNLPISIFLAAMKRSKAVEVSTISHGA